MGAISVRGDVTKLQVEIKKAVASDNLSYGQEKVVKHIAVIATCLMDLHYMEDVQWRKNINIQKHLLTKISVQMSLRLYASKQKRCWRL